MMWTAEVVEDFKNDTDVLYALAAPLAFSQFTADYKIQPIQLRKYIKHIQQPWGIQADNVHLHRLIVLKTNFSAVVLELTF